MTGYLRRLAARSRRAPQPALEARLPPVFPPRLLGPAERAPARAPIDAPASPRTEERVVVPGESVPVRAETPRPGRMARTVEEQPSRTRPRPAPTVDRVEVTPRAGGSSGEETSPTTVTQPAGSVDAPYGVSEDDEPVAGAPVRAEDERSDRDSLREGTVVASPRTAAPAARVPAPTVEGAEPDVGEAAIPVEAFPVMAGPAPPPIPGSAPVSAVPAEPQPIEVHIGTIEITADPPPAPPAVRRSPARRGLETYARLRSYEWDDPA